MTASTTVPRISATVGAGGTNTAADVRVVQDLLNRAARAELAVDGDCGPATCGAIRSYQSGFLKAPDGRVDPDGLTLRRLAADAGERSEAPRSDPATASGPADGARLTQFARQGPGHYAYADSERQYGTDAMLQLLTGTAAALHRAGLEMGVGDISFVQGGLMPRTRPTRAGATSICVRCARTTPAGRSRSVTRSTAGTEPAPWWRVCCPIRRCAVSCSTTRRSPVCGPTPGTTTICTWKWDSERRRPHKEVATGSSGQPIWPARRLLVS